MNPHHRDRTPPAMTELETRAFQAKLAFHAAWNRINATADARAAEGLLRDLYAPDAAWNGPHPINGLTGADAVVDGFWRPLAAALPDLERGFDILMSGAFKDGAWVAGTGHYTGTFTAPWLGIRPTGRVLTVRYGEFAKVQGGRIVESYTIMDIPDVLRQAGHPPFAFTLGLEDRVPGPATADGVMLSPADPAASSQSLKLVEAMIAGLMGYDGRTLDSMGMERFWDARRMMWYGPAGIGACRGLKGFQDVHQRPFLAAFPDRKGGDHKCRVGEGAYVGSTGWPSVRATHTGGGFLGLPPTGRAIGMRVMDFWRREGDLLLENWVFIDLLDLALQMGVDVLARLREAGRIA